MSRLRVLLAAVTALALGVGTAAAQVPAGRLIDQARVQIVDELAADSAFVLLQLALDRNSGATINERRDALMLLGVVVLLRSNGENRVEAKQAFVQALRLDSAYQVTQAIRDMAAGVGVNAVWNEARSEVPLPAAPAPVAVVAPLSVAVDLPLDITLPVDTSGRYRIETTPNRDARVVVQLSPADVPANIVWADTQVARGAVARTWNLRTSQGTLVPDGRYALRVRAIDAQNQVSGTSERILVVSRVAVDTTDHPAAPTPSAFQPETLRLRRASPAVLLVGLGIGAAAYVMPTALGNTQLNSGRAGDGTAVAVAGAASLAGIYGFLSGSRARYSPANARANQELRQRHATQTADVIRRNRAARDAAPVRVRVEQ